MTEDKYFGEWVYCESEEKEEARNYLQFWKKNLIRKFRMHGIQPEIIDEQIIEREPSMVSMLALVGTMGIKLKVRATWEYELQ